jgi:hypothetical protein
LEEELARPQRPAHLRSGLKTRFSLLSRFLLRLLVSRWPNRPLNEVFGTEPAPIPPSPEEVLQPYQQACRQRWVEMAEGFVAIQVVVYLCQFFIQLRNLAWSIVICSSLLLAGTSYPFYPEKLLLFLLLGLVGVAVISVFSVLFAINRNELVSRISGTTPNRLTPDANFISSLFTYALPALGVVVVQLSGAFRFVFEPLLRVLR